MESDTHFDRPLTSCNVKVIDLLQFLMIEDCRIIVPKISDDVGVNLGSAHAAQTVQFVGCQLLAGSPWQNTCAIVLTQQFLENTVLVRYCNILTQLLPWLSENFGCFFNWKCYREGGVFEARDYIIANATMKLYCDLDHIKTFIINK